MGPMDQSDVNRIRCDNQIHGWDYHQTTTVKAQGLEMINMEQGQGRNHSIQCHLPLDRRPFREGMMDGRVLWRHFPGGLQSLRLQEGDERPRHQVEMALQTNTCPTRQATKTRPHGLVQTAPTPRAGRAGTGCGTIWVHILHEDKVGMECAMMRRSRMDSHREAQVELVGEGITAWLTSHRTLILPAQQVAMM
jgi:hypothetical protein